MTLRLSRLSALALIFCSPLVSAQTNQGIWETPFNHVAPASMTHHSDMHARYIELDIDNDVLPPFPPPPNPVIYFKAPASSKLAPKGYYMVFLVTNGQGVPKGTPSVATWALLR